MGDHAAYRKLGQSAEKWLRLAERRRDSFRELYSSGRWRRYYSEEQFLSRLRDIACICDRWAMIVQQTRPPDDTPALEIEQRSAA
jgi:uncharacterized repeat protein (TIGR03809 family)